MTSGSPRLSIVIATHNRREVTLRTLDQVRGCELQRDDYELIVVDNNSEDGTADALVAERDVRLIALGQNRGSCAKAFGLREARGEIVLMLDDDSYPKPGALQRMLRRFEIDSGLGAAAFFVDLVDGRQECSALPHVFVGCGVGVRRAALEQVGGLDATFFMQAEEYDLAFRLLQAGWLIEAFPDLRVLHLKSPTARISERTAYHDMRNNLRVCARYLPTVALDAYRCDWTQRYEALARLSGHQDATARGQRDGRWLGRFERPLYVRWRLGRDAFEQVFAWERIAQQMERLWLEGVRRVILADLGKNIFAFWRGAQQAGLRISAIGDDRFASVIPTYRDVPLLPLDEALTHSADALVIANTSYVHAERRRSALEARTGLPPVHCWFRAPGMPACPEALAPATAESPC